MKVPSEPNAPSVAMAWMWLSPFPVPRALTKLRKIRLVGDGYRIDLSVLNTLPLEEIEFEDVGCLWANADVLKGISTLTTINGKPAAEFWQQKP